MQKFRCILIWRFPSILLVFTKSLVGKLNFHRYLISWFYPTREIRKKFDAREKCFTVSNSHETRMQLDLTNGAE